MRKLIVTKKGAEINKKNDWFEGRQISVHENLAADFIDRGIASDPEQGEALKEEVKPKNKKNK